MINQVENEILDEISKNYGSKIVDLINKLPIDQKRIAMFAAISSKKDTSHKNMLNTLKNSENSVIIKQIDKIIERFRKYVPIGQVEKKSFGEVFTPFTLVNEMLDTLPVEVWSNPNLKWADLCNGMGNFMIVVIKRLMIGLETWEPNEVKRYRHIIEKMIYVAELQPKNMFLWMLSIDPKSKLNLNIYTGNSLESGLDEHMKNVWKVDKFDIIVGNPPFTQMIDLDFLIKYYSISEKILIVHPSTWLLDEKNKQKKFITTKNIINNKLEKIILFNGNKIFNVQLFIPCVITYINKNKNTDDIFCYDKINNINITYNSIYDINRFSDIKYKILKDKILKFTINNNLLQHKNKNYGNFFINLAQIRGHVDLKSKSNMLLDDFYTVITKDTVVENKITKHMFFSFKTNNEATNFLEYLKTNVARFSLSIYKNNSQLDRGELESIPWLDFTKSWTDKDLYSYFNITNEEIEFIEKIIPKYYDN